MSGPNLPPNLPPNEDRAPILLGVYWGLFPLTVAVMSLRFYTRTITRQIGWDDWFMLAAWVIFLLTFDMLNTDIR